MFNQLRSLKGKKVRHFSHNDNDGVSPQVLSRLSTLDFEFFTHDDHLNFEKKLEETIVEFEQASQRTYMNHAILITDIAPNTDSESLIKRLNYLFEDGLTVVLLDHHDTAKPIAEQYPRWAFIESHLDTVATCATELYYLYLKEKELLVSPFELSPYLASFVEEVRSYDTWDWSHTGNVFAKELNSVLYTVGRDQYIEMQLQKNKEYIYKNANSANYTFNSVETILVDVENKREENYIKSRQNRINETVWSVDGKEYIVGVVFADQFHSTLGNTLSIENKHLDFIALVDVNAGKCSLRSVHTRLHLGEIAKAIANGGGHRMAAGFRFKNAELVPQLERTLKVRSIQHAKNQMITDFKEKRIS